ncbi:MAG: histidine phosphatase family protein [Sulfuricella sp.]|nr:histidine phosphatase family protein [Sulfuricella sp.]
MKTLIDFMRHGEPVGGRRYRGKCDDPLSETGWAQMRGAVSGACPWDAIVSSPLLRCAEFAAELGGQRQLPVTLDERLAELGYGAWEGKTSAEIEAVSPGALLRYRRNPVQCRPADAENLDEFVARFSAAWRAILAAHAGRHVLVVAHAGVIRMALAHALDIPLNNMFRIEAAYAGLTRFKIEGNGDEAVVSLVFHGGRP